MVESDWEGPWVTADHAYEVCSTGIPGGDKLFAGISEYDDYLAYVRRKEGYEPGDTLALIAPFLIAYNLTNEFLVDVARVNANFIAGSFEAIGILGKLGYTLRIISTSYCQYIYHTTGLAHILKGNVRCTRFPITRYRDSVTDKDKQLVRDMAREIMNLPKMGISSSTTEKNLPPDALETIEKLDNFFWRDLPETSFKQVLDEVKPIGGQRKLQALKKLLEQDGKRLNESETIGDSITDWIMLRETKAARGLAISFNGNDYAVRNANVALMSKNCMITPVVVDLFRRSGIEGVEEVLGNWSFKTLQWAVQERRIGRSLLKRFLKSIGGSKNLPDAVWVTDDNLAATIRRSKEVRKVVRGTSVGVLG